ncbi:Endonuclease/exonuclease/phosphatase domain-containing protein [Abortiporus biennis]
MRCSTAFTMFVLGTFTAALALVHHSLAVSITDIQGPAWLSPLQGQSVQNLTGVVVAKGKSGFFLRGDPSPDIRVSNGLNVFSSSTSVLSQVNVGDLISLSGKVSEFRSSTAPDNLFTTELQSPTNITVLSTNNTFSPIVIGKDRSPPTQSLSALDVGKDGWLTVPNNQSQVDSANATLQPTKFGMDFWSSLEGQLVTIPNPVALDFENTFGEFWVHGDWTVTGKNGRGGLTLTFGPNGIPDANPEVIIIGAPLDGTKNPKVCVGKTFQDITGVVVYQFGFYYVLPLTAPVVVSTPDPTVPPTTLKSDSNACVLTIGDYNVENLAPTSKTLPTVANHISNFLLTPDIMFLQEIQDNNGETNDGTVSANLTLTTLSNNIANLTSAINYNFASIDPVNNQDGGAPGGNIRQAYLFNPAKVKLAANSTPGDATTATKAIRSHNGGVSLTLNPGRIDPSNIAAWNSSRKPLVAQWETTSGHTFFTINVHGTAKLDSSSTQGTFRPPVNNLVEQRTAQVEAIAKFIKSILILDPLASIILAGDFNEFVQTRSVFKALDGIMLELDEISGIPPVERYTYVFDQTTEQLDHIFVSPVVALRGTQVEHIHVNNWASTISLRTSDHDPSVAKVKVC